MLREEHHQSGRRFRITPSGLAIVALLVVIAVLGFLYLKESDEKTGGDSTAVGATQPALTPPGSTQGASTAEATALAAFRAYVSKDLRALLALVAPDSQPSRELTASQILGDDNLAGCDTQNAKALVPRGNDVDVQVVFPSPCGRSRLGDRFRFCEVSLRQLSGRWYVYGPTASLIRCQS